MNEIIEKTEEPVAPKDGDACVPAVSVEQAGQEVDGKPSDAEIGETVSHQPQETASKSEKEVGNCDENCTKEENESKSITQNDVQANQNNDALIEKVVETETLEEAAKDYINEENAPTPMDISNNDIPIAEILEPASITTDDHVISINNEPISVETLETLESNTITVENNVDIKDAITIPSIDIPENMDTEVDSPESKLAIEESILPIERSTSPPIVIAQMPDHSPPRLTSPPLIVPTIKETQIEQTITPKPPSPIKLGTKVVMPKELVLPREQLDILKRHLNQEQFLSIKQLAEVTSQKEPSTENQNEVLSAVSDKSAPEKVHKIISPVLEKQLTIERIEEKSVQKTPSPEICTQKLSPPLNQTFPSSQNLTQKLTSSEVTIQTLSNSQVKSDKQELSKQNENKREASSQKIVSSESIVQKPNQDSLNKEPDIVILPKKVPSPEITKVEKLPSPSSEVAAILKSPINDVDMADLAEKSDDKKKASPAKGVQNVNGDATKDEQPVKRRASEEVEAESPLKRLCQEVERTFPHHDSMINDYIQTATKNNIDEIQKQTEQLLAEIQTLRELAQKKEHEWNNILHLKKVKEEILLRLLRKKQVISFEKAPEVNGSGKDPFDYLNQAKNLAIDKSDEISGLALKQPTPPMNPSPMPMNVSVNSSMGNPMNMNAPINSMSHMLQPPVMPVTTHFNPLAGLPPPYDKVAHMQMQKPVYPQTMMMAGPTMPGFPRDMNGQMPASYLPMGRQGPTKDVKSIIADYRQRNPDITPRRGRRMKTTMNPGMMNNPRQIAPKVEGLGNLGMIFNNLDMNQKAMLERLTQMQAANLSNGMSFKDVLVQFASMQQPNMMPSRDMTSRGEMPSRGDISRGDMTSRCDMPSRGDMTSRGDITRGDMPSRPDMIPNRPEANTREAPTRHESVQRSEHRTRRPDRHSEDAVKPERTAASPRLPPPPYPEISLLPVSGGQDGQSSLLHGILTKQASPSQSRSPTLAKLLTSPERKQASLLTFGQAKNCGEITITPVQPPQPEPQPDKQEEVVQLDDEESPASSASETERPEAEPEPTEEPEAAEETPLCQGCRKRDAQFVCAGCANQWYCSRDCQVAAWDEHSEMCSG